MNHIISTTDAMLVINWMISYSLSPNFTKEYESLNADNLSTFSNKVLSILLAAHPSLCDNKFELKINDVRFVGHPLRFVI